MKRTTFYFCVAALTFLLGITLDLILTDKLEQVELSPTDAHTFQVSYCALNLVNEFNNPSEKADRKAELAGKFVRAGNKETASRLLFEALQISESIEDPLDKAGAVWRISENGEIEHLEKALLIARTIKDSNLHHRIWAYRELAENYIRLGRADQAESVLDEAVLFSQSLKYDDREGKELDLSFLGQLYAQAGACEKALQTSLGFKNAARRGEINRESAICLASKSSPSRAFATAKAITIYVDMQVEAFVGIAEIFAKANNKKLALQALADAVKTVQMEEWTNYDDSQTDVLMKIAEGYQTIGEDKESLKILDKAAILTSLIRNPNFKYPAIAHVAKGFAKAHSFEKALELASKENNPMLLAQIAENMFETEEKARAKEILNKAFELAEQQPYYFNQSKAQTFVKIAGIYADNGFNLEAVNLLNYIQKNVSYQIDYYQDSYIEKAISVCLKLKEYNLAMDFALIPKDMQDKVLAIADVEIEVNRNRADIGDETRIKLSQLACE